MSIFQPACEPPDQIDRRCYVLFSYQWEVLGPVDANWQPLGALPRLHSLDEEEHYLGVYRGQHCFARRCLDAVEPPSAHRWSSLRGLIVGGWIDDTEFTLLSAAMQIFYWNRDHQFCGRCGSATVEVSGERARRCESCQQHFYPRISPCVIAVVERDDEILLAHNANFPAGLYSALAGFIEAGESAEEALRREVFEEVGIRVGEVSYFASQSWPFPGQLMIGYHAQYESGEIEVDGVEITDARWYRAEDLPFVPGAGTLSGRLIGDFLHRHKSP